jgi:hypothetical protein
MAKAIDKDSIVTGTGSDTSTSNGSARGTDNDTVKLHPT